MGFKWLDRRTYGQEQIIIKEAAIEVAMQKAGNPWFIDVYWFVGFAWHCLISYYCSAISAVLHQVEEIIKGAKGQAARVQIQNEATEFHAVCHATLHSFTLLASFWDCRSKHFSHKATIKQLMLVQQRQAEVGVGLWQGELIVHASIQYLHYLA